MRAYGTGSIRAYKTRNGERYQVSLPPLTTGGKRAWKSYPTRAAAEQQLALACAAVAQGEVEHISAMTLQLYGERWLAGRRHRTAADDRSRWQRFLASRPLAQLALSEITPGQIKRLLEGLQRTRKLVPVAGKRFAKATAKEFISAQTIRHVYGLLRRILSDAVIDGHLERNPCDGYRPPDAEKLRAKQLRTFLSRDEIEHLLGCTAVDLKYRLIYEVAIFTGLREGELWGLRWGDLELGPSPRCTARHSYGGKTKNTKTREFVLLPRAATALRRWRELSITTQATDLVFPGLRGRMHAEGYDAEWAGRGKNRELAGIRAGVRFHDFRHTFASHLIMGTWGAAWRIEEVREYIGHSSISVTQQYAHLSDDHLSELAGRTCG